jgi:hypothetical protein
MIASRGKGAWMGIRSSDGARVAAGSEYFLVLILVLKIAGPSGIFCRPCRESSSMLDPFNTRIANRGAQFESPLRHQLLDDSPG